MSAQAIATSTANTENAIIHRLSKTRPTLFTGFPSVSVGGWAIGAPDRHGFETCTIALPL
jgi:hypothetical protein